MIWLKENEKFIGYVPLLKKEYSENEILEMSKYSIYQGFSELSKLVMQIQGIEGKYIAFRNCFIPAITCFPVKRLIDIKFYFSSLECLLLTNEKRIDLYTTQVIEVFKNLTFYKVFEYTKEEIFAKVAQERLLIDQLIKPETSKSIDEDVKHSLIRYENDSYIAFTTLNKLLESKGYTLNDNLFADIDDKLKSKIYEERKAKQTITLKEEFF